MAVITIKRWLLAFIIATMWYVWSSDKHWLNKQTFQCGAWINILRDHAEKRHPDGWILASEQPQNRVLCTGECLIRTNIYTSDMSSKTRYFPLIPVSDSWDHSCFPAASCFSLSVAWTRRAGDGPRVTWGKCAPTVKPNLLKKKKKGSRLIKEKEDRVTKERAFQSSPWDSWRLISKFILKHWSLGAWPMSAGLMGPKESRAEFGNVVLNTNTEKLRFLKVPLTF